MPVSVRRDPFGKEPVPKYRPLRTPHARVLLALMPKRPSDPVCEWPVFTRAQMRVACGFSPTNSMNRILHGVKEGPHKHLGLIGEGYLEEVPIDVDGLIEMNYRLTPKGLQVCRSLQSDGAHK